MIIDIFQQLSFILREIGHLALGALDSDRDTHIVA